MKINFRRKLKPKEIMICPGPEKEPQKMPYEKAAYKMGFNSISSKPTQPSHRLTESRIQLMRDIADLEANLNISLQRLHKQPFSDEFKQLVGHFNNIESLLAILPKVTVTKQSSQKDIVIKTLNEQATLFMTTLEMISAAARGGDSDESTEVKPTQRDDRPHEESESVDNEFTEPVYG